jgi:hypothetical protein
MGSGIGAQRTKSMNLPGMLAAWVASIMLLGSAMAFAQDNEPKDVPILLKMIPAATEGSATDPLNATYVVDGQTMKLVDGLHEIQAVPGATTKITSFVFGKPVFGDLDGDDDDDAALFLVQQPGGSGTFYYVVASLNLTGTYEGTNAVILGDRIAPQNVRISNGVIIVNYADRRQEEPMATSPSEGKSKYLTLKEDVLKEIKPLGEEELILEGWVTIGHEVRSFVPCSGNRALWLLGNSPAYQEIMTAYQESLPNAKPYIPLFMILAGKYAPRPTDGFGAQYGGAFLATQLVRVWPKGNCRSERPPT